MFLPIGDEPNNPQRIPWMNYALIGLNVAAYLLALGQGLGDERGGPSGYDTFVLRWAYDAADPSFVTLFSSMFLHSGFMHLAGNMLFLWIFGDNVESRLGSFGYLVSYLSLGALATLTFGFVTADTTLPLVGASGAISGVQGLYWIACPRHKVKIFVWLFIIIITVIRVNARWVMAFWFFMQDALPMIVGRGPTGGGVAHAAHLGGFIGGLLLMLIIRSMFPGMDGIDDEELRHARLYKGGSSSTKRYGHARRRDPYVSRSGPRPPRARPKRPPSPPPLPPRDEY